MSDDFINNEIQRYNVKVETYTKFSVTIANYFENVTDDIIEIMYSYFSDDTKQYLLKNYLKYQNRNKKYFADLVCTYIRNDPSSYNEDFSMYLRMDFDFFSKYVSVVSKNKPKLQLIKSLGIDSDQNVYLARDNKNTEWVVKWEQFNDRRFKQIDNYKKLESMGAQVPIVIDDYTLLGQSVLVIERLEKLDGNDNISDVAKQLLTTQLKYIHKFGVYNDLKPDNIMKKRLLDNSKRYFIIDMDISTKRIPNNFKMYARNISTPYYCSQMIISSECNSTSYRADLFELSFVLNELFLQRHYPEYSIENNRKGMLQMPYQKVKFLLELLHQPILGVTTEYCNAVYSLPEYHIPEDNTYEKLGELIGNPKSPDETNLQSKIRQYKRSENAPIEKCYMCFSSNVELLCTNCESVVCQKMYCKEKHVCK